MVPVFRLRRCVVWLLPLLLVVGPVRVALAQPQISDPILQIETEMHSANISDESVDAAGRLLLTASTDKTARLWSLQDGHLLTVLRPPQKAGMEGVLDAAALSPDGQTAAIGGNTGAAFDGKNYIYIFDARSGRMTTRVSLDREKAARLAFSPDGKVLVAGLYLLGGMRAWRTDDWTKIGEDTNYDLTVRTISFDRAGRFVTAGADGTVRLYAPDAHLLISTRVGVKRFDKKYIVCGACFGGVEASGPGDRMVELYAPVAAALSPDGTEVAVTPGFDAKLVEVLSGNELKPLFVPDTQGLKAWPFIRQDTSGPEERAIFAKLDALPGVAAALAAPFWSPDGETLYAMGDIGGGSKEHFVAKWSAAGHASREKEALQPKSSAIKALPKGGFVYDQLAFDTAGTPTAWGTVGTPADVTRQSAMIDFVAKNDGFRLSPDGQSVTFGYIKNGIKYATMALRTRELQSAARPPRDPNDASQEFDAPKSYRGTDHLDVSARGGMLLFDLKSRSARWELKRGDRIRDAMLSTDGRLAVSASSDGRIRWYRASDGQLLLTLFVHNDGKRWVLWTPSGYYDASPGGEDLLGWHVNRRPDQAADFFPASRFHDRLFRPDVVKLVLTTLDEIAALAQADAASGRSEPKVTDADIATLTPPVLDLISAPERFNSERVTIRFSVHTPPGAPMVGDPQIKVNGDWQPNARAVGQIDADDSRQVVVGPLPQHDSRLEIYGTNHNGRSEPLTLALKWDGRAAVAPGQQGSAAEHKPRLFVLAVGISQYQHADLRLNFAARDAEQFVAAMNAQKGKLYGDVIVKLLRNDEATQAGVKAGLDWFAGQTAADDVGVLFLAGHGVQTPDQAYFYAPADFDPARQRETGVNYQAIRGALDKFGTAGNKVLFFVDTCYPGGALGPNLTASNEDSLAALLSRPDEGVIVLSAAKGDQLSYESAQWQDGAFTMALLEGIVGAKADPAQSGEISLFDLESYIHKRVLVLTEHRQEPMLSMPQGGVTDFTIATH